MVLHAARHYHNINHELNVIASYASYFVMFQGMVDILQHANNEMVNDNRLGECKITDNVSVISSS
jgi:hypothetical protein